MLVPSLILAVLLLVGGWFWLTQPIAPVQRVHNATLSVSPERLERHVRMLSEECSPRDGWHPANMERAAAYIARQLEPSGAIVSEQPFPAAGATFRNVIGAFGPDTVDRVVVGAHYDAAEGHAGADDNASGVAGLIELARLLRDQPLSRRVELVAFALEEAPFFGTAEMGSFVHDLLLHAAGGRVAAMISLEMIGYFSDRTGSQGFLFAALKALYPTTGRWSWLRVRRFGSCSSAALFRSRSRHASPCRVSDFGIRDGDFRPVRGSVSSPRLRGCGIE